MVRLAGDPSLRRRLGVQARQFVEQHYAWRCTAQIRCDVYEDIIARHKTRKARWW
ncbi:MAG: hypothetical protein HY709_09540 [Candidatus Latescibacteria bacterium]|nr:hypothetical protein [Candidatus Latescibacterota bacterium]